MVLPVDVKVEGEEKQEQKTVNNNTERAVFTAKTD